MPNPLNAATRFLGILVATAAVAAGAVTGAPLAHADRSEADIYRLPAGYEQTRPGTILAGKSVEVPALRTLPVAARAWQLLYRTTAADGSPYAAVTTVLVPDGPSQSRPLLSFQMAYDSVDPACAPSRTLTSDVASGVAAGTLSLDIASAAAALARGWAVSLPDPGGVDAHFFTPREMGYATLDGIRAAANFAPAGLAGAKTKVAMWGYSGGGIASSWAAELQPQYAPELHVAGAAIGAPVADMFGALHAASGRATAGLVPIGMASIAKDDPEFAARLQDYLTPLGRQVIAETAEQCARPVVSKNAFRPVGEYLSKPVAEVLSDPVIAAAMTARGRGWHAPVIPVYVYNGVHDEVSVIGGTDRMVNSYCAEGASVTYVRDDLPDLVSNHGIVAITGIGGAFEWITRALSSDQPVQPSGCDIRTVATTATDLANVRVLPGFLQSMAQTLLAARLSAGR
ncbi:lipase family protein [Nocardia sp. NPDC051832]|uniref:lipase family protein n=1 Tax=Nocardia sp. NPDC051832 TaxID=3155673 RepID=UPI0034184010